MIKLQLCGWKWAMALGLFFFPLSLRALDPDKSVFQFNCQNWTRQNGLPGDKISTVTQTKNGYIWLGTQNGLVRFDGLEFTSVVVDLPQSQNKEVRKLCPSKDGGLWFAINGGAFGGYDRGKFTLLGDDRWNQEGMNPTTIMEARDGAVWTGGDLGHGRWLKDRPAESFFDETNSGIVLSICEDASDRIWLGTVEHGLFCWANGKSFQIPDDSLKKRNISALAADTNGLIWVGTGQGLLCYDSQGRPRQIPSFYPEVKALLVDRHGSLWVGTTGAGLARFHNGTFTFLTKADGLVSDNITSLFEDAEGSLWIGTQDGLSQLTDLKFPIYSTKEGFTDGSCHSVSVSSKGGLWATTSSGATYFDGTTATIFAKGDLLANRYVKLGFEARNGDVYLVDGDKNINVLSDGKLLRRYPSQEWASAFAEDVEGVLLSMGSPEQLLRVKDGELRPYEFKDGQTPPFYWINSMCVARDGAIWIASVNGIFRVKDGSSQQWSTTEGLNSKRVQWICQDEDGSIWAGMATGMARIKNGRLSTITAENGLKDDRIYAIVPDNFGSFWISSGRGIMRAARQNLNDFADGKILRIQCELFDGLESIKFNDRTDQEFSGCKTRDGRVWFPNPQGAVMIDPRGYFTDALAPPVSIREIRVDGTELKDRNNPALSSHAEQVEFLFSALSYISPRKIQIRYQLEGLDPDWVDAGAARSAVYNKLRPGNYTFRVQACNADGVWNTTGDSFSLALPLPYYETAWFLSLCGLALALLVFGAFRWQVRRMESRQRKLQAENDRLEVRVLERTRELAEANSSLHMEIDKREQLHRQLMDASRQAGMAEVATGVLHNVGNVLNSVNTSAGVLSEHLRSSKVSGVARVSELLEEHKDNLGNYFTSEDRGPRLIDYLKMLSLHLTEDQTLVLKELQELTRNIDHIKEIVAMQQNYAKAAGVVEKLSVPALVEDALRMHSGALARHAVRVVKQFEDTPEIEVDKHKVIQILINLISNAKYALDQATGEKVLTVGISRNGGERIRLFVRDNGMGVARENLTRIFAHGFTTRKTGHGFGLHSGALAAREMGGALIVESDGPGQGATFILELPLRPPERGAGETLDRGELKSGELVKGE
jgi:ligand-binding sensor domain-containing protein/signal transduction histidine kinase